jgi:hypothetical protein
VAGTEHEHRDEHERRALRPYRWFVVLLFALAIATLCGFILRGIIRTLDRLPSSAGLHRPEEVDVRALRACAEDLERLEARIRRAGGEAVSGAFPEEQAALDWRRTADALELERLTIVARCHLEEPGADPAQRELSFAAAKIEALLSGYGLLRARFEAETGLDARDARRALDRGQLDLRGRR